MRSYLEKKKAEIKAIEIMAADRLSVCSSCNKYNNRTKRCTLCGCFMHAKTRIRGAKCPEEKW